MIFTKGFNFDDEYGNYVMINIYMTDVSYTDEFNDTVSIRVDSISDEQLSSLKEKLQEKYSFEDIENNVIAINVPSVNVYDLVKVYIAPMIIALILSLVYFVYLNI